MNQKLINYLRKNAFLWYAVKDRVSFWYLENYRFYNEISVSRLFQKHYKACLKSAPQFTNVDESISNNIKKYFEDGYFTHVDDVSRELTQKILSHIEENNLFDGTNLIDNPAKNIPAVTEYIRYLDPTMKGIFSSHYAVWNVKIFRSQHLADQPDGSALWHTDGGPNPIHVMVNLCSVDQNNGPLEILKWKPSLNILKGINQYFRKTMESIGFEQFDELDRMAKRKIKCDFYKDQINTLYQDEIYSHQGEVGKFVLFTPNTLHKGGWPQKEDHERIAMVIKFYPSRNHINLDELKNSGVVKVKPTPSSPFLDL